MKINRRNFLKAISVGIATAIVSPKIIAEAFSENNYKPIQSIKSASCNIKYNYREELRSRLAEWWAEEYDQQIFKYLAGIDPK